MATKKLAKQAPSTKKRSYSMTALSEERAKEIEEKFVQEYKQKKSKPDYPKILKVSFRSRKDCDKFALLIQKTIDFSEKQIDFKIPNWRNHGKWRFSGEPKEQTSITGLKPEHAKHWIGMPDFEQEKNDWIYHYCLYSFRKFDKAALESEYSKYLLSKMGAFKENERIQMGFNFTQK